MPQGTPVEIKPAKGRPMLTWVGKRPLRHVTAFPAQLVEKFEPLSAPENLQSAIWEDWPDAYPHAGLLFHGDNKEVLAHLLANGFRLGSAPPGTCWGSSSPFRRRLQPQRRRCRSRHRPPPPGRRRARPSPAPAAPQRPGRAAPGCPLPSGWWWRRIPVPRGAHVGLDDDVVARLHEALDAAQRRQGRRGDGCRVGAAGGNQMGLASRWRWRRAPGGCSGRVRCGGLRLLTRATARQRQHGAGAQELQKVPAPYFVE